MKSISVEQDMILFSACAIELLGPTWWRWVKFIPSFGVSPDVFIDTFVIFCFFRLKLFSIAMRFSAEILSPYGEFPSQWVLGIRSLFLIILLNHLPQEIQILHFLGCQDFFRIQSSGIYFWSIYLFQFLSLSRQNIVFPNSAREQSMSWKDAPNLLFLRFPVCQEVLVISQIATAFQWIQPPPIIRSRLQWYGWCLFFYSTYSSSCNSACLWSRCFRFCVFTFEASPSESDFSLSEKCASIAPTSPPD